MVGDIEATINKVASTWNHGGITSETDVTAKLLIPILHALGWDQSPDNRIKLEQRTGQERADIALFCGTDCRVVIEVKGPKENLGIHEKQLAGYAAFLGAEYAILTNGKTWNYYLPKERGEFSSLLYVSIQDIFDENALPGGVTLSELLSINAVRSYGAADTAKRLYRLQLVNDFADEVMRAVAGLSVGARQEFIASARQCIDNISTEVADPLNRIVESLTQMGDIVTQAMFIGNQPPTSIQLPHKMTLPDTTISIGNWRELLLETAKWLIQKGHSLPIGSEGPGKVPIVSLTGNESSAYEKIGSYFINTRATAKDYVKRARWLLERCGYSPDDLSYE